MATASGEKAKYFCESCGAEVAGNARFCPKCGRFFSSVRCPNCGHTGSVAAFKNGCPSCHYVPPVTDAAPQKKKKKKLSRKSKKSISKAFNSYDEKSASRSQEDVPTWLYIISIFLLIFIVAIVLYRCH